MERKIKTRTCADKDCSHVFTPYLSTQKYCSYTCTRKNKKKPGERKSYEFKRTPIRKISKKQSRKNAEYSRIRTEFFRDPLNKICRVFPQRKAVEIHHMMGRVGYADDWAKERGISLLVDTRYWLPVSREAHDKIEGNPEWAYAMGYSVRRSQRV